MAGDRAGEASGFDYIVVGAGGAGCVLADRLSRDPANRVLLLEAGGKANGPLVHMPKGIAKLVAKADHIWTFPVGGQGPNGQGGDENNAAPARSREVWIRGRGLGGSTAINGMVYMRGHPLDYAAWQDHAGPDWGWEAMKQAFLAIEDHALGANEHRGQGGPLHVAPGGFRYRFADAAIEAGREMGLEPVDDLNRDGREGIGYYSFTIRNGRRVSAATAFLAPARRRANLQVRTGVTVRRVLVENAVACGVEADVDGRTVIFRARGEVILAAGAMMSPVLLQLSGIGPRPVLERAGVPVVAESPDVGDNLREHLYLKITHRLTGDRGLNWRFRGPGLALSLAQYYAFRSGPMAVGVSEVGAILRSRPDLAQPDVQLSLSAVSFAPGDGKMGVRLPRPEARPGMGANVMFVNLTSRGRLSIRSPDVRVPPEVEPNWLATPEDRATVVAGVRHVRAFLRQPALRFCLGEELSPGPQVETDEEILAAVRALATCGHHAVGTCRMGRDGGAVLDPMLRVRGVAGLRVVDCSAMPGIVSGNTAGPVMAFAWRAADLILGERGQ